MNNYKYYTPIKLAECLIALLPKKEYKSIIDICCGSWNLLKAAKEVYPNAKFVGVDVDVNVHIHKIKNSRFYNRDGRKFAISQKKNRRVYDLILSNPPYGYLKENERIFVNRKVPYQGLVNKRYENEMTQANLMLAHENSVLVFILPSTFVEGITNIKARKDIVRDYHIDSIIKLPEDTFGNSNISTYAIIITKHIGNYKNTKFYDALFGNEWSIKHKKDIPYQKIIEGNWINEKQINHAAIFTYRGNISSRLFEKKGSRILHCSNMIVNNKWIPSVKYCSIENEKLYKIAKKGDILVNRVGKCAGYWTINDIDNIIISDCIIVISNCNKKIIADLEKNSIAGRINIPLRGVSTKYVTAMDIHSLFTW